MTVDELLPQLRDLIIEACHIQEDIPDIVDADAALIGEQSPFGLDSLDAVEIVVAVQRRFGVRIGGETSGREVLQSLRSLAEYVAANG